MAERKPRATLRLGARERARMQVFVIAVICLSLFVALRPMFIHLIQVRDFQTCQTNVRKLAQAVTTYSQDWDDALPLAGTWLDGVQGYLTPTTGTAFSPETILKCPRDKSGSPCSYAYNELLQGISTTTRKAGSPEAAVRRQIGRIDRAALIVEKHGSERNRSFVIGNWDAVARIMTRPHALPAPTGSMVDGSGRPLWRSDEDLAARAGRKF